MIQKPHHIKLHHTEIYIYTTHQQLQQFLIYVSLVEREGKMMCRKKVMKCDETVKCSIWLTKRVTNQYFRNVTKWLWRIVWYPINIITSDLRYHFVPGIDWSRDWRMLNRYPRITGNGNESDFCSLPVTEHAQRVKVPFGPGNRLGPWHRLTVACRIPSAGH